MINKYKYKWKRKALPYSNMPTNKDRINSEKKSFYNHLRKNNSGKNYQWMLNLEFDKEWNVYRVSKLSPHILLINYKKKLGNQTVFSKMIKTNIYIKRQMEIMCPWTWYPEKDTTWIIWYSRQKIYKLNLIIRTSEKPKWSL